MPVLCSHRRLGFAIRTGQSIPTIDILTVSAVNSKRSKAKRLNQSRNRRIMHRLLVVHSLASKTGTAAQDSTLGPLSCTGWVYQPIPLWAGVGKHAPGLILSQPLSLIELSGVRNYHFRPEFADWILSTTVSAPRRQARDGQAPWRNLPQDHNPMSRLQVVVCST